MSTDSIRLELMELVNKHYNAKAKETACLVCGADDWRFRGLSIADSYVGREYQRSFASQAPIAPDLFDYDLTMAIITCANCGQTLYFSLHQVEGAMALLTENIIQRKGEG